MMEVKLPFRVKCIDAKNKPNDIPTSKWVVEGEFYTVVKVAKLLIQGGMVGFKLEELNITLNENVRNNKDIKVGEYEITYEPMIGEAKTITVKVEEDTTPRDTENFWRSLLSKTNKTYKLEDRQKKIKKIVKK